MPCGWEGNRRFATLTMRHRLQWFIQLRPHGLRKGNEHPAYTYHHLPLPLKEMGLYSLGYTKTVRT